MGIVSDPVPVAGFVENFSPMPRIAPPPFGSDSVGKSAGVLGAAPPSEGAEREDPAAAPGAPCHRGVAPRAPAARSSVGTFVRPVSDAPEQQNYFRGRSAKSHRHRNSTYYGFRRTVSPTVGGPFGVPP